jgi:hypothetical protein
LRFWENTDFGKKYCILYSAIFSKTNCGEFCQSDTNKPYNGTPDRCNSASLSSTALKTFHFMAPKHDKIRFPMWQFLNQPLFCAKTTLNPRRFWYRYQIELLERCLIKECSSEDRRRH